MKSLEILTLLTCCILFFFSCKTDPVVPNEEEVITTLNYTLIGSSGDTAVFYFQDLDGDGGNAPMMTADTLMANSTYTGQLTLLNETETPAENITDEVIGEAEEHQVFYSITLNNTSVSYSDTDSNNKPLGIQTNLTTGAAEHGSMTIVLKHEPNKDATGVSNGLIDNAGGETDIEVTFHMHVQ